MSRTSMSSIGRFALIGVGIVAIVVTTFAGIVIAAERAEVPAEVEALMRRVFMFLEDGEWERADEYCERVLDIAPEHAAAYVAKLCAELRIESAEELANHTEPLDDMLNYRRAIRFGNPADIARLNGYNQAIHTRREQRIQELKEKHENALRYSVSISAGYRHTVGLQSNGRVVAVGWDNHDQCNVGDWRNIIAVSAGSFHTVGLQSDGTVVSVGNNQHGQCNIGNWRDIAEIQAGYMHTVGLRRDGTVIATGMNNVGQCNVENWRDIVSVSAGSFHTVGLKRDGTVVTVGSNSNGQRNTEDWRDVIAISASAGFDHTAALRVDGTVITVGQGQHNVEDWRGIISISTGAGHIVGLKEDGTVIAVGRNSEGQCNVDSWQDIVALTA